MQHPGYSRLYCVYIYIILDHSLSFVRWVCSFPRCFFRFSQSMPLRTTSFSRNENITVLARPAVPLRAVQVLREMLRPWRRPVRPNVRQTKQQRRTASASTANHN